MPILAAFVKLYGLRISFGVAALISFVKFDSGMFHPHITGTDEVLGVVLSLPKMLNDRLGGHLEITFTPRTLESAAAFSARLNIRVAIFSTTWAAASLE
jgi:hypothetical protein